MNHIGIQVDGILNLDKQSDSTSMEAVRVVKRLTSQRHVGHGGTLDPQATGVLPVCFGQATRVMEYLIDGEKLYRARIKLGVSTDTYDAQGQVTRVETVPEINLEDIEQTLKPFLGVINQTPPMYSALKKDGRRLYELAREGVEVERPARQVEIHKLAVLAWERPNLDIDIACGRGVYIRSLAHDLGESLGCGGHLTSLIRLKTGPFELSHAFTLNQFSEKCQKGEWMKSLYPVDHVFLHFRIITIGPKEWATLKNGRSVSLDPRTNHAAHLERVRAYSIDNQFIGLLRFDKSKGLWQPHKLFNLKEASPYAQEGSYIVSASV
jgi:tRNA pseudouridine55 synthase